MGSTCLSDLLNSQLKNQHRIKSVLGRLGERKKFLVGNVNDFFSIYKYGKRTRGFRQSIYSPPLFVHRNPNRSAPWRRTTRIPSPAASRRPKSATTKRISSSTARSQTPGPSPTSPAPNSTLASPSSSSTPSGGSAGGRVRGGHAGRAPPQAPGCRGERGYERQAAQGHLAPLQHRGSAS